MQAPVSRCAMFSMYYVPDSYHVPIMYFLCSEFLRLRGNKMGRDDCQGQNLPGSQKVMTLESCNWGQGHRLPDCCVVPPDLLGAWNQSGKDRGIFHFQDFSWI